MRTNQNGDPVDLWYNKVYSDKTQLPFEYFALPVCPTGNAVIRENLGEVLRGDRFVKSSYEVRALGVGGGDACACGEN